MRNPLRFPILAATLLAVCSFTVPTYADQQSVTGCTGCNGYEFSATLTPTGGSNYTLDFKIKNVGGSAAYVFNWSLTLFTSDSTITSASLTNYTSDYRSAAGKSNNGNARCNSTLSNAVCVEPTAPTTSLLTLSNFGDTITFHLNLSCSNCTELANWIFLASGNCISNVHANCYAISTTGTALPEPSVLMLLGIPGLVGVRSLLRKLRL